MGRPPRSVTWCAVCGDVALYRPCWHGSNVVLDLVPAGGAQVVREAVKCCKPNGFMYLPELQNAVQRMRERARRKG